MMMALSRLRPRGNLQVNEEKREEGGEKGAKDAASSNRQKYVVHTPQSMQSVEECGQEVEVKCAIESLQPYQLYDLCRSMKYDFILL